MTYINSVDIQGRLTVPPQHVSAHADECKCFVETFGSVPDRSHKGGVREYRNVLQVHARGDLASWCFHTLDAGDTVRVSGHVRLYGSRRDIRGRMGVDVIADSIEPVAKGPGYYEPGDIRGQGRSAARLDYDFEPKVVFRPVAMSEIGI
jgi:hypothetical protein